jgi:hypothetical protein
MPKNEDASEFELQNEASTGTMRGIGSGAVEDTTTRKIQDSTNFYRGMFALMASYDWDKGKFSEHPQDVDLRNEAFELLNLPPHLSPQFNKAKADELLQSLGNIRNKTESGEIPDESRSGDYVRNLIKLSQARFGERKPK